MHESSKNHLPEADGFEKAGLTPEPYEAVKAPRVGEAGVSTGRLLDRVLLSGTDHPGIGRLVRLRVKGEPCGDEGRIHVAKLRPLGRNGRSARVSVANGRRYEPGEKRCLKRRTWTR